MNNDELRDWIAQMESDYRTDGPVRLCCMRRHRGVRCPDGRVMCELCFGKFYDNELMGDAKDPSLRWDICLECGERENWAVMVFAMTGGRRSARG